VNVIGVVCSLVVYRPLKNFAILSKPIVRWDLAARIRDPSNAWFWSVQNTLVCRYFRKGLSNLPFPVGPRPTYLSTALRFRIAIHLPKALHRTRFVDNRLLCQRDGLLADARRNCNWQWPPWQVGIHDFFGVRKRNRCPSRGSPDCGHRMGSATAA